MLDATDFLQAARGRGFGFYAGVPCSFLTPLINRVIAAAEIDYVGAASEGEAVAIAAGAWLAGQRTAVMCQNSGLGNTVNPLTSLNFPFRIPTLMIVTWRGEPGIPDEPQHELMGAITPVLLDVMRIAHRPFPDAPGKVEPALAAADTAMSENGLPFALIMAHGAVGDEPLDARAPPPRPAGRRDDVTTGGTRPRRIDVLDRVLASVPGNAALVATTGKCGRELFTLADRPQHLYQVGSMGCASAMGLGVALNSPRPVLVLDGDGAALMKLGTLATIGAYAPPNLVHLILDNGVHDSTGGQPTVSASVDFAAAAAACGYADATVADDLAGFTTALQSALGKPGPHMIHMRIAPGSAPNLGRPTVAPHDVARRFQAFLAGD